MAEPIDLEAVKNRRMTAEIDYNDKQWWTTYDQLTQLMATSGLYRTSLTSAVLAALIDIMTIENAELEAVKSDLVRTLNCFQRT